MVAMLEENKITNKRKADEFLLLKFHQHGRCQEEWGVGRSVSRPIEDLKLGDK